MDLAVTYNALTLTAPVTVRPSTTATHTTRAAIQCASASLVPCLTATATAPITSLAVTDYARRYSFYTPELNLMAETEETTLPAPRIAYEYIWFVGQPLAQIETSTGAIAWYFNDHLGTPVLTTDGSGAVDWRVEREPYGAIYAVRAGAGRHQPLAFPGQEDGGDLSYNVFRWYRSGWGRYSQADPKGLGPDRNLLRYALSNPVGVYDPLGLQGVLYVPGPPPATNPIYPPLTPPGCKVGPWTFVKDVTFDKGWYGIWKLANAQEFSFITTKGDLGSGWCLCQYELVDVVHKYKKAELFQQVISCCGQKPSVVYKTANSKEGFSGEPSMHDPKKFSKVAKAPMANGECGCETSWTEPF